MDNPEISSPKSKTLGILGQIILLFNKNLVTKLRQDKRKLAGEILLPVIYLSLLCYMVTLEKIKTYEPVKTTLEEPVNVLDSFSFSPTKFLTVHVAPNDNEVIQLTEKMNKILQLHNATNESESPQLKFKYYDSEDELIQQYNFPDSEIETAIIFKRKNTTSEAFTYEIRLNPDTLHLHSLQLPLISTKKAGHETCRHISKSALESPETCPVNGYFYSNFLALQFLVDQAYLKLKAQTTLLVSVTLENYPAAEYVAGISTYLRVLIPIYSVIPLVHLINNLLVLIVTEKEKKIKDGLRMVGVHEFSYWISWFGVYSIISLIFAVMFTIVMHFMNVLRNFNPFLLFLIFFIFGLSIITFAFMLTPFFHKPKTAGLVGSLIMQFTSFLFLIQTFMIGSNNVVLNFIKLLSPVAFTTAIDEACAHEYTGGIGWHDLVPGEKGQSVLFSLLFLIFDTGFYFLVAIYLDNIIPSEFGVRKHPLFCFMPSKRPLSSRISRSSSINRSATFEEEFNDTQNEDIEPVDQILIGKEAIRIRHIRKTYNTSWTGKNKVEAVKGVSMNIYDGQITAILGKNGAGKTTLFNILIGLITPTSGTASVFGYNISNSYDMDCLRRMTGICLQSDLHFDALTVYEHLEFYGKLRGLSGEQLKNEVEALLLDLKLEEKRDMESSKLSGGQKRKLSVAISLIGDPKIILLDEPTASMDPMSRRQLWGLLQRKKEGKVILLTTHFMDEADSLADRKAIIHDGVLKCLGSSLFLKTKFGVGYYLTIELNDRNCSSEPCDKLIRKWVPPALASKKVIGNEVKYSLPLADVLKFSGLFADIEELIFLSTHGVRSYGVSMTTLEEVFLKISTDSDSLPSFPQNETQSQLNSQVNVMDHEFNLIPPESEIVRSSCRIILWMCYLRILRLVRSPQACFFILVMPVLLVAIGLIIVGQSANKYAETSLHASKLRELYSNELNIALNEVDNEDSLSVFLKDFGFHVIPFNGNFSNLLDINQPAGTMAAINIEQITTLAEKYLNFRVMINGTYVHSPPALVSMINQYIERRVLGSQAVGIDAISKPFTSKVFKQFDESAIYAVFLLAPAFVFVAVAIVIEIVTDREIKARNHLRVNGLTFSEYFLSLITVYGFLSLLLTCLQLSLIQIFSIQAYLNVFAFSVTSALLILFILPSLLFSIAFSYVFDKLETAQNVFSQLVSWSSMILSIIMIILDAAFPGESFVIIVHGVFSALNVFYIPFGVFYFVNKQHLICTFMDTCDNLSWNNYLGTEFLVMFFSMLIQIPIFTAFIFIADVLKNGGSLCDLCVFAWKTKPTHNQSRRISIPEEDDDVSPTSPISNFSTDDDVLMEKEHVAELFDMPVTDENCVLAVKELEKQYPIKMTDGDGIKKKTLKSVVKNVNFAIKKGEVFGLLGHNGAGKTTVLKLITAEEAADFGSILLCGYNITSNISDAFRSLGYCPQHDALWDNVTLKEHIKLYSVIRGICKADFPGVTKEILTGLRIEEHANKKAQELSGGTKRKLSYALSVLGAPKTVIMDEPSTGMDPQSKRFLWNTVLGTFKESRGALLTTHSMEEADILCTKIAIMVKGSIICIGSPQHLKSKYGSGFTLEVRLSTAGPAYVDYHAQNSSETNWIQPSTSGKVKSDGNFTFTYVKEHFPEARLTESNGNRAVFSVPRRSIKSISSTFALLEKLKEHGDIDEYSFSQTTLEQVFLSFAKENEEE